MTSGPSDHFPILLTFANPCLDKHVRFKIPMRLASLPKLHVRIRERWAQELHRCLITRSNAGWPSKRSFGL